MLLVCWICGARTTARSVRSWISKGEVQSWRLRRGQYGAGFPRERSRAGGYGAVSTELDSQGSGSELAATARSARSWTPKREVQSWRLRRGQHGAGPPRERSGVAATARARSWTSKVGGPELAATARARSWTSKGGGPELAATARSARSWTSKGGGSELAVTARSARSWISKGEVKSGRLRGGQHGAGLPRGQVQSWRLRRVASSRELAAIAQ